MFQNKEVLMSKYFIFLILITGCNSKSELQVGQCVQKPDEVHKWKVAHIKNEFLTLDSIGTEQKRQMQVRKSEGWIETSCN